VTGIDIPERVREGTGALTAVYLFLAHTRETSEDALAAQLGMPKLSLLPLLETLEAEGYVYRPADDRQQVISLIAPPPTPRLPSDTPGLAGFTD